MGRTAIGRYSVGNTEQSGRLIAVGWVVSFFFINDYLGTVFGLHSTRPYNYTTLQSTVQDVLLGFNHLVLLTILVVIVLLLRKGDARPSLAVSVYCWLFVLYVPLYAISLFVMSWDGQSVQLMSLENTTRQLLMLALTATSIYIIGKAIVVETGVLDAEAS